MATIKAEPFDFTFDPGATALIVIDMQRDFIEPGGFGESLGNNVALLEAIVPTVARLIGGFRDAGVPVIHTMECHKPDLSDCPPSKRERGSPSRRIGDPGSMGRLLISGEPGTTNASFEQDAYWLTLICAEQRTFGGIRISRAPSRDSPSAAPSLASPASSIPSDPIWLWVRGAMPADPLSPGAPSAGCRLGWSAWT